MKKYINELLFVITRNVSGKGIAGLGDCAGAQSLGAGYFSQLG
jgi:hypothetical protein